MVGGHHHHHAQRHQQREQIVLRTIDAAISKITASVEQANGDRKVDHQLEEIPHQVRDEHVAEGQHHLRFHGRNRDYRSQQQGRLGQVVGQRRGNAPGKGAGEHDHQRHHGDENLSRCRVEIGDNEIHLLTSPERFFSRTFDGRRALMAVCSPRRGAATHPPRRASPR